MLLPQGALLATNLAHTHLSILAHGHAAHLTATLEGEHLSMLARVLSQSPEYTCPTPAGGGPRGCHDGGAREQAARDEPPVGDGAGGCGHQVHPVGAALSGGSPRCGGPGPAHVWACKGRRRSNSRSGAMWDWQGLGESRQVLRRAHIRLKKRTDV